MKVDHFIIGTHDVPGSARFYVELFGFREGPAFDGGVNLEGEACDLVVCALERPRLPNPAHLAFRAETLAEFEGLLNRSERLNLEPRSLPEKASPRGAGTFKKGGGRYKNFYVLDPSGVNVEVIIRGCSDSLVPEAVPEAHERMG